MELAVTGMTDRQRRYRANYRERVAGWYNGWLHVFIIYAIGVHRALRLPVQPVRGDAAGVARPSRSPSSSAISSSGGSTAT